MKRTLLLLVCVAVATCSKRRLTTRLRRNNDRKIAMSKIKSIAQELFRKHGHQKLFQL